MLRRVPVIVWFLLPTAIVLVVGVWLLSKGAGSSTVDDTKPLPVSKPVAGVQEFKIVGRDHVNVGTAVTTYNSSPPTSGPHWPADAKNGVYENQLPDEQLVHNLEHGYVWISYKAGSEASPEAGISESDKKKLTEIVTGDSWKMILEPREKNDARIVLAVWGRLLKMDSLDEGKIKEFISIYRDKGPEKTPD